MAGALTVTSHVMHTFFCLMPFFLPSDVGKLTAAKGMRKSRVSRQTVPSGQKNCTAFFKPKTSCQHQQQSGVHVYEP